MNRVFILIGSNINKEHNVPTAVFQLAQHCRICAVSPVYETIPMGFRDQPNFFNAAILLETPHDALTLKEQILVPIEQALQRVRTNNINGARTIDLDIGLFNDEVFEYGRPNGKMRRVPDKDLLRFPHAAAPIADIAPNMLHPETGETFRAIADRLTEMTQEDGQPILWKRDDISLEERRVI